MPSELTPGLVQALPIGVPSTLHSSDVVTEGMSMRYRIVQSRGGLALERTSKERFRLSCGMVMFSHDGGNTR